MNIKKIDTLKSNFRILFIILLLYLIINVHTQYRIIIPYQQIINQPQSERTINIILNFLSAIMVRLLQVLAFFDIISTLLAIKNHEHILLTINLKKVGPTINQLNTAFQSKLKEYSNKYPRLFNLSFTFSGTILAVLLSVLSPFKIFQLKIITLLVFVILLLFLIYKVNIIRLVAENSYNLDIITAIPFSIWLGYKNIINTSIYDTIALKKSLIILDTLSLFSIFFLVNFIAIYIKSFFSNSGIKSRKLLMSSYILILVIIAIYLYIPYSKNKTIDLPATLMTFSYSYGFISRGLLGSIIHLLAKFLNTGVTAKLIDTFSKIGTFVFVLSLILFFRFVINIATHCLSDKSLSEETSVNAILLVFLFSIGFGFSTFYLGMGYFDIYMIMLTIVCTVLIISNRSLWAIIPLTAICVLIHQGYVFMYFNIVLVLLFYRTFINISSKNINKKSLVIFILSAITCSVLFIYFQFFSHIKAGYTYDDIYTYAEQILSRLGVYNVIIQQELFGIKFDYSNTLIIYSKHLLVAIVFFSPYIFLLFKLWKRVISNATSKLHKLVYLIMPFGIITTLPLWIMHIDYGRWCYAVCFYEFIIILSLIAMKDKHFIIAFNDTAKSIQQKPVLLLFLFLYIKSIGPFRWTYINPFLSTVIKWIDRILLLCKNIM
ncbi:MAG TPA: hypothetical protein PK604_08745 [Acetivibrio clariflavus]|nr:hypothetical protein [Acetivibrio clariflavus]